MSEDPLRQIEKFFHRVIRERIAPLPAAADLPLPQLKPPLPTREKPSWFPVPGMYGGFNYWLEERDGEQRLISESWCRVVEGSGMRHEVTASGSQLIDEGFV